MKLNINVFGIYFDIHKFIRDMTRRVDDKMFL